jgi:hypothetical protein
MSSACHLEAKCATINMAILTDSSERSQCVGQDQRKSRRSPLAIARFSRKRQSGLYVISLTPKGKLKNVAGKLETHFNDEGSQASNKAGAFPL